MGKKLFSLIGLFNHIRFSPKVSVVFGDLVLVHAAKDDIRHGGALFGPERGPLSVGSHNSIGRTAGECFTGPVPVGDDMVLVDDKDGNHAPLDNLGKLLFTFCKTLFLIMEVFGPVFYDPGDTVGEPVKNRIDIIAAGCVQGQFLFGGHFFRFDFKIIQKSNGIVMVQNSHVFRDGWILRRSEVSVFGKMNHKVKIFHQIYRCNIGGGMHPLFFGILEAVRSLSATGHSQYPHIFEGEGFR